jgi:hypothetical protein
VQLPTKLAALAFLVAAWDPTAPVFFEHGFLTGGDYLQISETERHGYAMGLLDGLFASAIIGGDHAVIARIKSCTLGMKSNQIMAIFDKYLRDHPGIWHQDADIHFLNSLSDVCPKVIWP